ncbi:nucleotidyltransferase family protein [Curtobacterium sp. MCSS17_008]|uniref:nucleotidyltransferase family protein n=1 Tax=Curtobacterium sp. MCSS17_008 TaxID=2175647 RepID=UPI000DA83CB9|nr:NTP transferase domain-containing protein [Curtobacterium sp. MCSS17_008]PZF58404.1 nucleotidyltransferase family protein [Curtobacterium sp. MCSS17_008]
MTGVLLAAGAGTRMGRPKALVRSADGTPWLHRATTALLDGGCGSVVVVLGAAAEDARRLVPDLPGARTVVAEGWAGGPGASLAAGVRALADGVAACVTLVDLPTMPAAAVRRVIGAAESPDVLRRAVFGGRPGHPVLVGPAHRTALLAAVTADPGDRSAGAWLRRAGAEWVACGDLWDGEDRDRPPVGGCDRASAASSCG